MTHFVSKTTSRGRVLWSAVVLTAALATPFAASAQDSVADFYRGKLVKLFVGSPSGGGYDLLARGIARHMPKHIPGSPNMIVTNMPGAGGVVVANHIYNIAPKDGTAIALSTNGTPTAGLLNPKAARFDVTKLSWIGSAMRVLQVAVARKSSNINSIDDLKKNTLVVGASSPGSGVHDLPMMANRLWGTKFKIITGYKTGEIPLAIERGEVDGFGAIGYTSFLTMMPKWRDGFNIVAQYGYEKHDDLQDVPLFPEPATELDSDALFLVFVRQDYGRPFFGPPGIPADRLAAIRKAFALTLSDPEFLAEINTSIAGAEIKLVPAENLEKYAARINKVTPEAVKRFRELLAPDK